MKIVFGDAQSSSIQLDSDRVFREEKEMDPERPPHPPIPLRLQDGAMEVCRILT